MTLAYAPNGLPAAIDNEELPRDYSPAAASWRLPADAHARHLDIDIDIEPVD
jgi:hypothetical protein